ncbi:MAG: DUF3048 domain-containing protein [Anaerolineae bacterium]|nr:DUF3048 domain-containing protein [Anaerolineae bacterium]MDW8172793.1 DUF3048 domain-containing protein [Anaerolineae bacterium]
MRRFSILGGLLFAVILAVQWFSIPASLGQFVTNTPLPVGPQTTSESVGGFSAPTETTSPAHSGSFGFATNTPSGPTSTPTTTPSPTSTPTATFTPTNTPTATFTSTHTPTPTATPIGPFSYPEGINPLTGQLYPNEDARNRRNLIVKISNYPPLVRPQTGLNMADVVFEVEAEGGVTRFAAIFRSQMPPLVGSIRSARLVDIELTTMYAALLAYSGTSEPIQRLLFSQPWAYRLISPSIGNNCEDAGFCRYPEEGKAFEHTLFGEPAKIWAEASRRGGDTNRGYRARGFAFSTIPNEGGLPANDVYIDWWGKANARWQYDEFSGRYLRFTDNVPHFDKGDGQQIWADNLIILEVTHARRPDLFPEGATYESLEIQLWDQGRAYVMREGKYHAGFWRRANTDEGTALQLFYGNNVPIMLKPGRSWVSIVRGLGSVVVSEQRADMVATATAIAGTPSPTPLSLPVDDGG